MPHDHFSVLLTPTYVCNCDCEYCYETKTSGVMELENFERIFLRVATYLQEHDITNLDLYWQGGEIFTLDPEWLLRAHDICREIAEKAGLRINYGLQSNLIGYRAHWRRVVAEMFNDEVGSSLDFPNLYRKVVGGTPETYNETWFRRYQEARDAGIHVGIIAVLHAGSLNVGAEEFYSYYVEKLGINCFQLNTPHPGGPPAPVKQGFPVDNDLLSDFYSDLFDIWMRKGRAEGVTISPFDQFVEHFRKGESRLSCIWSECCANIFVGIGPEGNVAQCEAWVASYPDHSFGNILACGDMAEIMNSPVRKQFLERPSRLMEQEDCAECEFLSICHGGCPLRAYSSTGRLFAKDPYCEADKTLFSLSRSAAIELDRMESKAH